MSHEIEIDRNAHAVSILDRMEEMMREESLCDFTINVGSEEIRTHRVVLAAGSDYFRSMLKSDMKESQSRSVNMGDIDFECMKICLDFIYNRNVTIPVEKYENLLYVANMLQLNKFCNYIYAQLEKELNSRLFFVTRRIADMYGHKKLQEKCVKFTEENFVSISKEDEFKDLDMEYVHKIISSKNVKMTEDEKLDVVLRFAKLEKKRKKQLTEMIEWVDLRKVSLEHRDEIMENEPLVSDNFKVYKIFTASTKGTLRKKLETSESQAQGKVVRVPTRKKAKVQDSSSDPFTHTAVDVTKPSGEWYQIQAAFKPFEASISDNLGSSPSLINDYLSRTLPTPTQSPVSLRTPEMGGPRSFPTATSSRMPTFTPTTPSNPPPWTKQVVSTMIDKDYYTYMQLVHANNLEQIKRQYNVSFSCKILDDAAKVEVVPLGSNSDVQKALLAVNKLSNEVSQNTAQDTIVVDPKIYPSDTADNIIRDLKPEFPQVHMDKVYSKPENILFTAPDGDKCRMAKEMFELFLERAPKITPGQAAASGDGSSDDHMLPVDKDLFEFIQLTRSDDFQNIWDQNGSKMDVNVVDDCAYVKIVQNGPLIKFNPSKAKTDLKNLYDDVSATAIQETIDIPKGINGQRIDDAIRLTKTVHKGVHIAKVLVTGSHILFIAQTQQECEAAMKLCEKVFRVPPK